ncbi:MAG: sensor histidine kinase [Planctomycetaceae bacterium]|nr:MAG: sensor histidine kinase [Planctomycetaceae bacterium]
MKQGLTFWALLLLPTLLLGIGTVWLVQREADRMEDNLAAFRTARLASLNQHAETAAANLLLAFEEVCEALLDTLAELSESSPEQFERALEALSAENPFVRASGLWRPPAGFVAGSLEGAVGELPWDVSELEIEQVEQRVLEQQLTRNQAFARGQLQTRRELDTLARSRADPARAAPEAAVGAAAPGRRMPGVVAESESASAELSPAAPEPSRSVRGWAWVGDPANRVLWGWILSHSRPQVRVLEVDTDFLYRNLQRLLPESRRQEVTWALSRDGLAESWPREFLTGATSLGSDLPGWTVHYAAPPGEPALEVAAFRWLGSALVLGITLSIGMGALLLRWQAVAAEHEARTKTTFLTNVSHELKTPLAAIQLYAEMLDAGKIQEEAKRRSYLQTIRHETGRLARLVANLLDQSRLDRDPGFRLKRVPLDAPMHLQDFLQQREAEIRAGGFALETRIAAARQRVHADPDALDQILSNLVDNALKYARDGGRLDVEGEADGPDGRYLIRVLDRGPGIPPSFRSRLFTSFARSQTRLERPHGGLGLGLSIARGLARKMGGDLQYAPRAGGGAVFTLSLNRSGS